MVCNTLSAGAMYLFRLVAVYSNNDNKHGRNSDRFFLSSSSTARSRGPSSAPVIVNVQAVSDTAISVRWQVRLIYLHFTSTQTVDSNFAHGAAT